MKGTLKRIGVMLIVLMLAAHPAWSESLDLSQRGSITLELSDNGNPVPGGKFCLYRVGDPVIQENNLCFVLCNDFRESAVSLDDLRLSGVADGLLAYVEKHPDLVRRSETADANGCVTFSDVSVGLYLVLQTPAVAEYPYENISAFVVTVPMTSEDGARFVFDVTANPKLVLKPQPTPSPTPRPTSPPASKLPQTGMRLWPIPVLGISGIGLFVVGWILCFSRKHHD